MVLTMKIESDKRHYYIKGLLNQLKVSPFQSDHQNHLLYTTIQLPHFDRPLEIVKSKNEVINTAIDYIKDLEAEVERLQYVARIIEAAKEKNND
jgi:hypothetical protein